MNDATVVVADAASTDEDNAVDIDVLANDTDVDGNAATLVSATNGTNGTTSINAATGVVTYTPNADFNGIDTFTYTNSEGNSETVTVTIDAVADAPDVSAPASISSVNSDLSFESNLNSVDTTGNITSVTSFGGQTATDGAQFARMYTSGGTQAQVEQQLGLSTGALDALGSNANDGSGMVTGLMLEAGDVVTFDWNFINGENSQSEINSGYNDIAVLSIDGTAQLLSSSSAVGPSGTSGWTTFTYTATSNGFVEFGWAVMNARDGAKDSNLLVDNVRVNGESLNPAAIELDLSASLTDIDGSESLTVQVSGVPSGATLSAGTDLGGGIWELTTADFPGLSITPASGFNGTISLNVQATATEASNNDTAIVNETIDITVSTLDNVSFGGSATGTGANNDMLVGRAGADTLDGGAGNDTLIGGAGIDTLIGGSGNDTLVGGIGNDILAGGTGTDTLIWNSGDEGTIGSPAIDTIQDFSGDDILNLSDLLQGESSDSVTLDAYLDFSYVGTDTIIDISVDGIAGPTQQIVLENNSLASGGVTDQVILDSLLTAGQIVTD